MRNDPHKCSTSSKTSSPNVLTKQENTEYRVQSNFFKLCVLESALNPVLDLSLTYETCDWLFSADRILWIISFSLQVYFFLLYICQIWGFSFWIGVAGEHCLVSWGGFLWKGKDLWGNKGNLGGEFYVEAGEFSDLRCLMNILWCSPPNDFNDLKVCAILGGFSSTVQQRILRFNLL